VRSALTVILAGLLSACSLVRTAPPPPAPLPPPAVAAPGAQAATGAAIANLAASLVGTPYQFGGADRAGFDCSGLVLFVHERVGLSVPRTALEQERAATPVPLAQLAPGDLVFFSIGSRRVNHVGIYAGGGRFIHAPRAGVAVSYADLGDGFYAHHLKSAGRFWSDAP
jgi:murein DD-endopeptidase